ncbi:MAG: 3-phosphoglycerate dehydrogenase [Bacteroides sp.]|nr:3-phosphoglycerate dehydrogenase [Bacteroidales bacterium]MBD5206410.1 3-phosphoglycerate dehydrogenase [Bacteroidales bacterium]MBD5224285.1 3-phosphoglycerate dehydrogenase [Bacteroidales bacterium]MBD5305494.1 3-phosphoglycerate dehydrogenase [Bacteroides sp.]MBD5349169.1 3-phosphoglycerate dehydrogenase [Bacteroides sp.]
MKILVFTEKPFAPAAVKAIENVINASGNELEVIEMGTRADLLEGVKNANGLIVRSDKIDEAVMEAAPNLKVIVRAGAGYDNIDLAAATKHGICVMNTPGQNSNAVAELVFGMVVMMCRNQYNGKSGSELKGKSLGIYAFGQVGRNVARIAKGFGMSLEALDKFVPDAMMEGEGVKPVHTPEELFSQNQFVSLHIPATPETKNSIGYDLVMKMPEGGVLINTARKEVIDEAGLIKALEERPDLRYVSDIKPDSAEEFEKKFAARVFFTPKKMGAQTAEANFNAGVAAAEQTVAYLKDGWNKYQVNK